MSDTVELTCMPWRAVHEYFLEVGAARTRSQLLRLSVSAMPRLIPFDREGGIFEVRGRYLDGVGASARRIRSYNAYYRHRFPLYANLPDGRPPVPDFTNSSVDWHGEIGNTEFGTDYVRTEGIAKTLTAPNPCLPLTFALHRSAFAPDFTEAEYAVLTVLTPHVNNLYECLPPHESPPASISPDALRLAFPFLTAREADVAALLCERCTAQEMASRLYLSARTVETHVARVYVKMGVHSRGEAIRRLLTARGSRND